MTPALPGNPRRERRFRVPSPQVRTRDIKAEAALAAKNRAERRERQKAMRDAEPSAGRYF